MIWETCEFITPQRLKSVKAGDSKQTRLWKTQIHTGTDFIHEHASLNSTSDKHVNLEIHIPTHSFNLCCSVTQSKINNYNAAPGLL